MQDAHTDARFDAMRAWLGTLDTSLNLQLDSLCPASSDAGFRRYFRVLTAEGKSFIAMDAPPEKENNEAFVRVDGLMREAGLNVPEILAKNLDAGYMLLSDLGTQTYLDVLNEENASELMNAATDALVKWQMASRPGVLPDYDEAVLRREIALFPEWYVGRHRGYMMTDKQQEIIGRTFDKIIAHNLKEARVFVHRDFMPRNLMATEPLPGVLDFQDALYGPVSYDIASLMRDAFLSWGESFVLDITIRYWQKARDAGVAVPHDFGEFWRDVEWMGMQRHLKVLGIFARINYRDGKPKYLADTPRFIHYVRQTANRYDELKPINWLLDQFEDIKTQAAFTY